MKIRTNCRGCGSSSLTKVVDLGIMPLAGGFLADAKAISSEQSYPLTANMCEKCFLVQIPEVIDPEILFQDYSFSSSTIQPLVNHFEAYARWLNDKFQPKSVVEFGCNDGVLVKPLAELGITAIGVDVSRNITEMARERGLNVLTGYFDQEMAAEIEGKYGRVDVVTGSNAFAHNDEPDRILEAAKRVLTDDGVLCLEVMYAGDCIEQFQWDTIYHEHLTFYSLTSLARLLDRFGFKVIVAERIPMHGGSLRVAATLNRDRRAEDSVDQVLAYERESKLAEVATWLDFGKKVEKKIGIVRDTLGRLKSSSRIWGYGAAGKATLWVNACGMDYLEAMVDASPLRAGKLMPGTHTPIVFPEELKKNPPDYIFVTAWNYAPQISAKEDWFKGIWITPLPELRFF